MKGKLLFLIIFLYINFSYSQSVSVLSDLSFENMIASMSVDFDCSSISNITSPNNSALHGQGFNSIGGYIFQNEPNFPFEAGIVLATSNVDSLATDTAGSSINSGDFNWPGDSDVEALLLNNEMTNNASVIEFDFIPFQETLSVDYILASNEYDPNSNFVCNFPDTFAFIISGPGISNVNSYNHDANPNTPDVNIDLGGLNIATINGTNIPVNPTNVHNQTGCSEGSMGEFAISGAYDAVNSNNNITQYFGQTLPLTATADLIPGQLYHIKLVVADASDSIFDSAIFIDALSFDIGFIPNDLPFDPDFSDFELPDCWQDSDGANFTIVSNCSETNENYIQLNGGNYYIESAPVEADLYSAIEVSWDMLNGCNDFAEAGKNLILEYFDGDNWNLLEVIDPINIPTSLSNNGTNNWLNKNYVFSSDLSKNFKIRFKREIGNNGEDDINIANFSIQPTTSCPLPNNLIIDDLTSTTANVSWSSINNYNGIYNYVVVEENDDPINGVAVMSGSIDSSINTINIDQLQDNTAYDFYIISTCDGSMNSVNFTTSTLSLTDFSFDANFKLYPNPSIDELKLENINSIDINAIEVFDITGKNLFNKNYRIQSPISIDVSSFESGIYFLRIRTDNHLFIKKFIKQ